MVGDGKYREFDATYIALRLAEADMQRYFRVTPPSVHQMILTLEKHGLITRIPGRARSIELLVPRADLPALE
jgi:DNA-binding MarR family transcriptional regulator